jgi:hypothetical protein
MQNIDESELQSYYSFDSIIFCMKITTKLDGML